MSRVYQVFGQTGTGKSTFAKTAPGRKFWAELDPGSYERASGEAKDESVEFHEYHAPLTALEDMGALDFAMVGQSGRGAVQINHKYVGWNETYWAFIKDFMDFIKGNPGTVVIDTSTLLWDMAQNALRQRIQEGSGDAAYKSDRLKRLEYQEPNSQLTQILQGSKGRGCNVILIAHRGEIWEGDKPTGRWKPDGWNKAMDSADVSLMFDVKNKKPVATVFKAGGCDLELVGREIVEPTFTKVEELINAATKLRKMGMPLPSLNEELLELAAQL